MKKTIIIVIFLGLLAVMFQNADASAKVTARIYYIETCEKCDMYVESAESWLRGMGVDVEEKPLMGNFENREELSTRLKRLGFPLELNSSVVIVLNESLVLAGPMPVHIIRQILDMYADREFPRVMICYDPYNDGKSYQVFDGEGGMRTYAASSSAKDWDMLRREANAQDKLRNYSLVGTTLAVLVFAAALIRKRIRSVRVVQEGYCLHFFRRGDTSRKIASSKETCRPQ